MSQFFAKDWNGAPFQLFGPPHVIALILVVLVNLSLVRLRGASLKTRRVIRYGLAATLVITESLWHIWNWSIGQWTIQTMLPLHICSAMVWICAFMLVTENYTLYEYIYFLGIGAASQALLTPDAGRYGFPHFRFFQAILSHGSIVTAAVYMTVVEGFRPYWMSLVRLAIAGNVYLAFVALVNALLGSDYMFIARKPDTPSLIDLLGPWPWYIVSLELIALVVCLLLYLPFAIRDWRAKAVAAQ